MPEEGSSRILFLDDDPRRAADFLAVHPSAVWVRTVPECIERLAESWDVVHLDHDLGGEIFVDSDRADCGMKVVRWLVKGNAGAHLKPALFVVHTHNMNAAGGMVRTLQDAGFETIYRPFGIDLLQWLEDEPQATEPPPALPGATPKTGWMGPFRRLIERLKGKGVVQSTSPPGPDPAR